MTPGAQVTLLRVLENKEVTRVSGHTPQPLNIRVVSATNREPAQHLTDRRLREDLYHRLAVLPNHIPLLTLTPLAQLDARVQADRGCRHRAAAGAPLAGQRPGVAQRARGDALRQNLTR